MSAAAAALLLAILLRAAVGSAPRAGAEDRVRDRLAEAASASVAASRCRGLSPPLLAGLAETVVVRLVGLPLAGAAVPTGHGGFLQVLECVCRRMSDSNIITHNTLIVYHTSKLTTLF